MKLTLLPGILLVCTFALKITQAQNTFHSVPAGGNWADPATWFEGVVPSGNDSVVVQSPVIIISYSCPCKSVYITETGFLGGASGGGHVLVNGSIYNKGIIGTSYFVLYGNIINDSIIHGTSAIINFKGSDHTITCAPGKSIDAQFLADDSLQNIFLLSDLEINNEPGNLGNSELFTQNHALKINGGSLEHCRIHALDTLFLNSIVGSVQITGNYKLYGVINILGRLDLEGLAVNHAKIRALAGTSSEINLLGDFINEDTLEASAAGNLDVNVSKNATNHGFWNSNVTRFTGAGNKHISNSAGHPFGGTQVTSENSGSTLFLDSDVEFSAASIYLYNNTLSCGDHILTANSTFDHGTISTESEIAGNSDFWNTILKGNLKLTGSNRFSNCSSEGVIENTGLMKDITFYGGFFNCYGHLENHGTIQSIHFNIYGNLTNTGSLSENSIVDVVGDTAQYILITKSIESPTSLYSNISGISYHWMLNGQDIPNQFSNSLYFGSLQLSDAGVYQCRVTTAEGTQYSRKIIINDVTAIPERIDFQHGLSVCPNPFTDKASVFFEINIPSEVKIVLMDQSGRRLAVLAEGKFPPGNHEIALEGTNLEQGIYLLQIEIINCGENIKRTLKLIHL